MEQLLITALGGSGSGLLAAFFYNKWQLSTLKEKIRKEESLEHEKLRVEIKSAEAEAKDYAKAMHTNLEKKLDSIDRKIDKIFDRIFELKS